MTEKEKIELLKQIQKLVERAEDAASGATMAENACASYETLMSARLA